MELTMTNCCQWSRFYQSSRPWRPCQTQLAMWYEPAPTSRRTWLACVVGTDPNHRHTHGNSATHYYILLVAVSTVYGIRFSRSGMSVLTSALCARLSWLLISFWVHIKSLHIIIIIIIIIIPLLFIAIHPSPSLLYTSGYFAVDVSSLKKVNVRVKSVKQNWRGNPSVLPCSLIHLSQKFHEDPISSLYVSK